MEFRILGPLEVAREGRALPAAANKPRALLAILLLHRGEAVSLERLADELWGERPPATAAKSIQVYVSQLRKVLGEGALQTRGRGYALAVEPDQVDAARFERMLERGLDDLARGRARDAAAVLSDALALWRGPALADFSYEPWARAEIARLEGLRLVAIEERIEADLALGRHATLIAELGGLVEAHPTRERLAAQLMLALYRSGRQAEALDVFRERRCRIVDELGIEPGPALRELETAILRQDPTLEAPARSSVTLLGRQRRRGGTLVALGGAALLIAGLAAGAVALTREGKTPVASPLEPLPASFCSPLAYESGANPRYMIVSDQDLKGPLTVLGSQITAAVEFILRERRFTAGPHSVAYQACDSRSSDTADDGACAANGRRYAAHPAVLGVVGPLGSGCAAQIIPIANAARSGPLAMVSPSNTRVALTRHGSDANSQEPQRYYPTGVRNYVRVIAADDFQVAAHAMLAQRLGIRRAFVLVDESFATSLAEVFRSAAEKLALDVVGSAEWPAPGDYRSTASKIKRSGADGVFLAGATDGEQVVRALRAALGPEVPILATDVFSEPELLSAIGRAGDGMRISVPGADPQAVTGARRELIRRLRDAVGEPHPYTISAVQATELLLDAIARSDGTRRSVVAELFASEVRDGVLGDFSITPAGDTTANQVSIYRIEDGEWRFDQVLTPPLSLVVSN